MAITGPYQRNWSGYVAFKVQSAKGTPATGSGATILPITGGNGGQLSKNVIQSKQVRQDGMMLRGRHGTQKTQGDYTGILQLGNFDAILEAVMRGTWATGASAITQAAMSSATLSVASNVITFSAGSVITAGARFLDTIVFSSGLAAGDLGKPLDIVGITATSITVAQNITDVAGPVASWSFQPKGHFLINPAAGSLQRRYFTIEEYYADIDQSIVYQDCVWSKFMLGMNPDATIDFNPSWTGTGQVVNEAVGASPYFTTPTMSDQIPLAVIDASFYSSSKGLLPDLSAASITVDLAPNVPAVVGAKFSPDVFDGQMQVSASMTRLRDDLTWASNFLNEDQLSLKLSVNVPGSSPTDFMGFGLPNFTFGGATGSGFKQDAGGMTDSATVPAGLVGIDSRGGAFRSTMVYAQRST